MPWGHVIDIAALPLGSATYWSLRGSSDSELLHHMKDRMSMVDLK